MWLHVVERGSRIPRRGGGSATMIRVLLAEDQALVRDGIKALLDLEEGITATAVGDGRAAVDAAAAAARAGGEPFDVAVLDAGATAFLLKDAHPDDPARAVRWLVEGRREA